MYITARKNGSLAVPGGRDVAPVINELLAAPGFAVRVATRDWHPATHISFAANHAGRTAYVDTVRIANPRNAAETVESRLWPVHCVQGTAGAALIPELDADRLDRVLDKGTDPAVEMYSPFYAPFRDPPRVADTGLAALLAEAGVTDVYVVGLAADYCVRAAAVDAVAEGFRAYLVEEGTRPVDAAAWPACREAIKAAGVKVVSVRDPEVARLMASPPSAP